MTELQYIEFILIPDIPNLDCAAVPHSLVNSE